jgi:hypothetical protein
MAKRVMINGEEVTPVNKVKLWELPGWTRGQIRRLIEAKQKEVKSKFKQASEAAEAARRNENRGHQG